MNATFGLKLDVPVYHNCENCNQNWITVMKNVSVICNAHTRQIHAYCGNCLCHYPRDFFNLSSYGMEYHSLDTFTSLKVNDEKIQTPRS